ncbi:MAG: nuclear transport factor 2 family protein [Bacteroidota bacterium]
MKNILTPLFLLLFTFSAFTQSTEEKAIIQTIESEHKAFSERNLDEYLSFVHKSENILWGNGIDLSVRGYKNVVQTFTDYFKNNSKPTPPNIFSNYQITLNAAGDRAMVSFDSTSKDGKMVLKEQRILVKTDGSWKIAAMMVLRVE